MAPSISTGLVTARVQDTISHCFRLPVLTHRQCFTISWHQFYICSGSKWLAQTLISNLVTTAVIKHIPKSGWSACASHLASVARLSCVVVANPQSADNWLEVFTGDIPFFTNPSTEGVVTTYNLSSNAGCRLILQTAAYRTSLRLFSSPSPHLAKRFQRSLKTAMSGQPFASSCQMTARQALHQSLWRSWMTNIHLPLVPCPTCRHLNLQNTIFQWLKMCFAEQLSPF